MKSFNPAISFVRVIAMLSIILGHVCTEYGINTFQFGGIGVEIFLFISGYLYGTKEINSYLHWGIKRWNRLIPPLWCAVAICAMITVVTGFSFEWKSLLLYVFCIQGISRILYLVKIPTLLGMGQTWFLTILIVCYIIMLLLKRFPKLEKNIDEHKAIYFLGAVIIQVLLCFVGIQIVYCLQFFMGYFLSKKDLNHAQNAWVTRPHVIMLTLFSVVSAAVRVVANQYIDGTILYDRIIARWSFCIISIWLIAILVLLCKKARIGQMVESRTWMLIDVMSYPLFLAHYMFLTGEMRVMIWLEKSICQLLAFVILTFLVATVITFLTEWKTVKRIIKSNRAGA